MITIGVRAHDFGKATPDELFARIADSGFECIQLALPKAIAGIESFDQVDAATVRAVDRALARTGLKLAVLGCYFDLSTADAAQSAAIAATTRKVMTIAQDLGAYCVASESSGGIVARNDRAAFERLVAQVQLHLEFARELKLPYCLEPVYYHALNSKERVLELKRRLGAECLELIYDPTNLMAPEYLEHQESYIASCLTAFEPMTTVFHIKDFLVGADTSHGYQRCRLGSGRLQTKTLHDFFSSHRSANYFVIREELAPADARFEVDYLKQLVGRA